MTHDIIDNRKVKLADNINRILPTTETARFAVGYLFLSGLENIADKLKGVEEARLLIGNTTNRETLEQLAEGYNYIKFIEDEAEKQKYPKKNESKNMASETAAKIQAGMELMEQTDEAEQLVRTLSDLIAEGKIKVRIYTKGRLHSKAYIFDYGKIYDEKGNLTTRHEKGIAIVGSSNLTLSGITHNTELNVLVQGNDNHAELVRWFEELWKEARDFDETLMQEIKQSWAMAPVKPYDIYMKTLYTLVKDRLEDEEGTEILWDDDIIKSLADFQKVAVNQVIQMIRDYGGGFVADVVGLGKSYVGAAIVKHFERTKHARPLIICPAGLVEMWERYNEVYQLNARVLSMGMLKEDEENNVRFLLEDVKYRDRDFVLVDESHNFRHPDTQRYKVLQAFLATGKRCCFLTATPRNKSVWDVYNQIKLFHQDDKTFLPIDPPNLREYFKSIEKNEKQLPDLLSHILYRRTRNQVLKWYGYDAQTHEKLDPSRIDEYKSGKRRAYIMVGERHQFFPKRELQTIEYSIEDTYQGLYQDIRRYLGKPRKKQLAKPKDDELTYARYGLWHYVHKDQQRREPYRSLHRAGFNLRGLMRVLLFKRFESSIYAFQQSVRKLIDSHRLFLKALNEGIVPAGEEAQYLIYEPNEAEERDIMEALRKASGKYKASDFNIELLKEHIEHDINLLNKILNLVEPITPEQDAKLKTLQTWLKSKPLKNGKQLIFTQYADTADYLYRNLNSGEKRRDIDVIYSGDKSKARVIGRFAPRANPEYKPKKGEHELKTVIATDVLAEGLNLQDCDKIINYDLHWNPVKLIQRFGRIDRIGSENEVVYGFNFLPETGIEENLRLKEKLQNRINEIQETIGEDSAILDPSEQINEEAMYAIYEGKDTPLDDYGDEQEDFVDLNEAEEILRLLKKENPGEYDRIANLRDGIRTAKSSGEKGLYVFCEAGNFQQLFLLDAKGNVVSRDIPRILNTIKCSSSEKGLTLPSGYNSSVMKVKRQFIEEVKHRQSKEHTISLTQAQRYVLRELGVLFENTKDDNLRSSINILEKAFRGPITTAVNRELNRIRRNGVTGEDMYKRLRDIYIQHNMKDWARQLSLLKENHKAPKIVCSEGLL